MKKFPAAWLDELRSRADIVRIVGGYVALKKNGSRYLGLCPFHHEKTASFVVYEQQQRYYCFGCKESGSVIQFIMDMERLSFQESVAFLAEQVHMPLPTLQEDPEYEMRRTRKERIYLANKMAAIKYHQHLWEDDGAEILGYLHSRGLSDTVIRRFGIGATPKGSSIGEALIKEGFTQEELIGAGLLVQREDRVFDMFRNRAMFPIIDAYGNILGFGGRAMGDQMPKYLNTSDTLAFNKRYTVYAMNMLRKLRNISRVLLVEGYMDVVSLSQFGVEGVVATLGTALTPEQAKLIGRYANEVHLAYDGDKAGQKAILRGLEVLESAQIPAKVLDFPQGMDPDEFIREKGVEAFKQLKPMSAVAYRMSREKVNVDLSQEEGRTQYAKACSVILRSVDEPVELENHLKRLSLETGYSREVLLMQMEITPKLEKFLTQKSPPASKVKPKTSSQSMAVNTLIAVMATGKVPLEMISLDLFEDEALQKIVMQMQQGYSAMALLDDQPDERSRSMLSEILNISTEELDDAGLLQMANDCITRINRERLQLEFDNIMKSLSTLNENEKHEQIARAMQLQQTLQTLQ